MRNTVQDPMVSDHAVLCALTAPPTDLLARSFAFSLSLLEVMFESHAVLETLKIFHHPELDSTVTESHGNDLENCRNMALATAKKRMPINYQKY